MCDDTTVVDVLQDVINGKPQPWRRKKRKSMILADSYDRQADDPSGRIDYYDRKAHRVKWCGSVLAFEVISGNDGAERKRLIHANFCRERLCPMCAWRRSIKMYYQVAKVMDQIELDHPDLVPVFLTLTIRNCCGNELRGTVKQVLGAWTHLLQHYSFRGVVQGWFRALEVTYNYKTDTYHPHIHAVLLVDKSYFVSKYYLTTADWVRLWRVSCKLDYDPVCDIRKVRNDKRKAVAEVAKYTLKDAEYLIYDQSDLTDRLVQTLGGALRGRRLYAYGGIMRTVARQLDVVDGRGDIDDVDLIHTGQENIRGDVATALLVYKWDFGLLDYLRDRQRGRSHTLR